MNLVHVDDLDAIEMPDGFVWRPVRRHFGIRAFGTNAYTPGTNGQIVEEHTEGQLGHEEIYLVLRGRVRFTVGDDEHELGPGQLVVVRDPELTRGAVALSDYQPWKTCPYDDYFTSGIIIAKSGTKSQSIATPSPKLVQQGRDPTSARIGRHS